MARRLLLEGSSFWKAICIYQSSLLKHTTRGFRKHVVTHGFTLYFGEVLEGMLGNFKKDLFLRALGWTEELCGVQPRTGYLCLTLKARQGRIEAFATYIGESIICMNARISLREAVAMLLEIIISYKSMDFTSTR